MLSYSIDIKLDELIKGECLEGEAVTKLVEEVGKATGGNMDTETARRKVDEETGKYTGEYQQ